MATYVISDIHGQYDKFEELLDEIDLKDDDTLYILGDVLDRGPNPIKTLLKIMEMPQVICLFGNHELMALECLEFLMEEVTDETLEKHGDRWVEDLALWQYNGGRSTIVEFSKISEEQRRDVIEYIKDMLAYEELRVGDNDFLLVHAGLGNYSPTKDIEDYSLRELVWKRADYDIQYFPDRYVVTGHTPTQNIKENPNPGYIYRNKNHIAIDCGACFRGGRMAAICLDTLEEYYSSTTIAVSLLAGGVD